MNRCKVGGTRVCLAAGDGLSWGVPACGSAHNSIENPAVYPE